MHTYFGNFLLTLWTVDSKLKYAILKYVFLSCFRYVTRRPGCAWIAWVGSRVKKSAWCLAMAWEETRSVSTPAMSSLLNIFKSLNKPNLAKRIITEGNFRFAYLIYLHINFVTSYWMSTHLLRIEITAELPWHPYVYEMFWNGFVWLPEIEHPQCNLMLA